MLEVVGWVGKRVGGKKELMLNAFKDYALLRKKF